MLRNTILATSRPKKIKAACLLEWEKIIWRSIKNARIGSWLEFFLENRASELRSRSSKIYPVWSRDDGSFQVVGRDRPMHHMLAVALW